MFEPFAPAIDAFAKRLARNYRELFGRTEPDHVPVLRATASGWRTRPAHGTSPQAGGAFGATRLADDEGRTHPGQVRLAPHSHKTSPEPALGGAAPVMGGPAPELCPQCGASRS